MAHYHDQLSMCLMNEGIAVRNRWRPRDPNGTIASGCYGIG
jgi:hypothetical protein